MKREVVPAVEKMISRLIEARQMSGLTHGDIAERIGVSKSSVSDLFGRRSEPRISTLLRCCDALSISLTTLMADMHDCGTMRVLNNASLIGVGEDEWSWLQHDIADLHFWTCLVKDNPDVYLSAAMGAALDRIRDNKDTYALFHSNLSLEETE